MNIRFAQNSQLSGRWEKTPIDCGLAIVSIVSSAKLAKIFELKSLVL